jgi:hypothetical protein
LGLSSGNGFEILGDTLTYTERIAMTEAASDRTKPKAALTEYIVLAQKGEDWKQVAKIGARSGEDAVKRHVSRGTSGSGGVFVAVPARSWQPMKVTAKVETTLVIEDVAS